MAIRKREAIRNKRKSNRGQSALAWVYRGAAILIAIVGAKTLIQTKPDDIYNIAALETIFFWLSIGAISLELILLLRYANTIMQDSDENNGVPEIKIDLRPIKEITERNQKIIEQLTGLSEKHENSVQLMKSHADSIVKIGNTMESLVNEEVNRKVKQAISDLISSKLNL